MMVSRLSLALEAGLVTLPEEGRIGLFNASGDVDLAGLAPDRCHAVQRFKPEFDQLVARGLTVSTAPEGAFAAVHVQMPRAKAYARYLVAAAWQACAPGGLILIDGQKTDGIDSIAKELKKRLGAVQSFVKAHGRMIWVIREEGPALDGLSPEWHAAPEGFQTAPGVFSAEKIDAGSRMLAGCLPPLKGRVADFGAGWGYLSAQVLTADAVTALDLIEADAAALDCARANIKDPRARFHWADATAFASGPFDVVIMNPPFHVSRAAEPDLGAAFIEAAAKVLTGSGHLWLVANRQLPYEAVLERSFRRVETVTSNSGFKVLSAQGPRRTR